MKISQNVPLSHRTSLRLGGPARYFAEVSSEEELVEALGFASEQRQAVWILGGGSNIVIPDSGVQGLVLSIALRGVSQTRAGNEISICAQAGEIWDDLVAISVNQELAGLECLSGIPGSVGATPIQNVGAYGQEVSHVIRTVRAYDRDREEFVELPATACRFAYRESRFKSQEPNRFIVTSVTFGLRPGGAPCLDYAEVARAVEGRQASLTEVRERVLALRRGKSMLLDAGDPNGRSCGSFFVNPIVEPALARMVEARFAPLNMPRYPQPDGRVKLSAAWLIERAGWEKGVRRGKVGLSSRHALALVCDEGASSSELIDFAHAVARQVHDRTGVELTPEPQYW